MTQNWRVAPATWINAARRVRYYARLPHMRERDGLVRAEPPPRFLQESHFRGVRARCETAHLASVAASLDRE